MDSLVVISLVLLTVGCVKCNADTQVQGQSGYSGQGSSFFLMQHVFKLEGKVETQLKHMEEDIEELKAKVDNLNGPPNGKDVTEEIKTMKSEFENLSEEFKSVKRDNIHLEAEVSQLQESNSALREGITTLQGKYSELEESNAELLESNSALQESNSALKEGITALQGKCSVLEEKDAALFESNSALQKSNSKLEESNVELQEAVSRLQSSGDGVTYVRWGRTVCPQGSETVYKGYVGGGRYNHQGAAANWLCLTREPEWGNYDSRGAGAQVYGGEYEFGDHHSNGGSGFFGQNLNDQDAPCVVCRPPRPSLVMIPGRKTCYAGWTVEYSGYLVAGAESHASATEFICLDRRPEAEAGGAPNHNGKTFYMAEAKCGSLNCPPYIEGRELTCVVCSK